MSGIVAYTLIDKITGQQWKHPKRRVYDTLSGLKQGYETCRWTKDYGYVHGKGYIPPPLFPGPFKVVELGIVSK